MRSRPVNDTDPLDYPFNLIQGPPGSVDLLTCWRVTFYWSSSMMSGMVTFDVTPSDEGLMTYTTFTIYIGLLFNIVILSTANSAVSSVDSIAQDSKCKLDRVTAYLRFQGVNTNLRNQIIEFYKHALSSSQTSENRTITSELPPQLAASLVLDTNRPLIAYCALFHVIDNAIILAMLDALQPGTLPPKQIVMKEGQPIGALYFIIRGLVQLSSTSGNFNTSVAGYTQPGRHARTCQPTTTTHYHVPPRTATHHHAPPPPQANLLTNHPSSIAICQQSSPPTNRHLSQSTAMRVSSGGLRLTHRPIGPSDPLWI